jgi:PIN domain nuclease of toxin-antitoxin system
MTYLLDTLYLLRTIGDSKRLSRKLREVIVNSENQILVSTISFWEISLKFSLGKLTINGFSPEDLRRLCGEMNFELIYLSPEESSTFHQLKGTHHKDPFDRMLVWQAIHRDFTLISKDEDIQKYVSDGLKILKA